MEKAKLKRSSLPRKHRGKKLRLSRSFGENIVLLLFLAIVGAFMALPLVYTLITAFKPVEELFIFPPRFFVRNPTVDNFIQMIQLTQEMWVPFSRYLFNSLFVAFGGTAAYVLIASMAAFPLAKYNSKLLKIYEAVIIWAILFRTEVTSIPLYVIIAKFRMIDTYWAIILPVMAGSFGVFLMRQFIDGFPNTTLEAARIDGAGEISIVFRIVMPVVKPAWLTLIVFTFQSFWNTTGIQYIYEENLKTLPVVLKQITTGGMARAGAASAVALVLLIPPILIFVLAQSSVVETMAHSGIK